MNGSGIESSQSNRSIKRISQSSVIKVYIAMLAMYVLSGIIQPNYFSLPYVMNTLVQASLLGVLCIGQTLAILTGGIDLSITATLNLVAVIVTAMSKSQNQILVIVAVLTLSAIIGLINGLGVTLLKATPIVMTLATKSILESVLYLYTKGMAKGSAPSWLRYIMTESVLSIRIALLIWLGISALIIILLEKTNFGRRLYAVGNSIGVSYYSGVNNNGILIGVYIISSVCAGIAGILITGYLGRAYIGMGDSYATPSIAAVVIGGTSILGGKGTYTGTIAGSIILYILLGILANLNIANAGKQIVYGMIILGVLLLYGKGEKES